MFNKSYNPDVLTCLANLSSDEVFTPPHIVNQMLDLLPQELFRDKDTTFLDPVCKSGVFLREIAKRLMEGLKDEIPDDEVRRNHIFKNQLYGIGITELTALLSRRSVYCSKTANGEFSVAKFDDEQGNLKYFETEHTWEGNSCKYCGVSKEIYNRGDELESYSYSFIHSQTPEKLFNMKFDVIIGNPPYQMNDGGGTGDSAKPIYNQFIEKSIQLNPSYLTMIVPSRWMKGGKGLDSFREKMKSDKSIQLIYDYEDGKQCFPSLNIDGGVCYFLWNKQHNGPVEYTFHSRNGDVLKSTRYLKTEFSDKIIRDNRQISIIEKVHQKSNNSFSSIVSSRNPFGFNSDFFNSPDRYLDVKFSPTPIERYIKIHGVKGKKGGSKRVVGYVNPESIQRNIKDVDSYKLYFSKAYMTTSTIPPEIIIGTPKSICTETFLLIGTFNTLHETQNCLKYIKTKFFRALLFFNRHSLNISKSSFDLIPYIPDLENISDSKLYELFDLTKEEIKYIDETIDYME